MRESLAFFAGGILKIHAEPKDGNYEPGNTSGDILCYLPALFGSQIGHALIIGFDLSNDLFSVQLLITNLNDLHEFRCTACATRDDHGKH
ncbi:hypothetical protein [Hyphomicrobium sulfonivorans]|uniref:hypothetical protein n=1 Tax=Hyphomicrobium sulfonivorans TaxID=121290 RepID=UPI0015710457|nr:hypothetical protein [Hyphomicrobium sulfonivorans]MBI1648334.1 hypothetical protein [Hyphomicrobium sulfonivorans]NSL71131.1 hypothetical protein [Hyphomicrobium sulfonivorans]